MFKIEGRDIPIVSTFDLLSLILLQSKSYYPEVESIGNWGTGFYFDSL